MPRKAKIAATLGPSSSELSVLTRMVEAGVDVARLNYSHGEQAQHADGARLLRRAARAAGRSICLMADLQGPRFRVGKLSGGRVELEEGQDVDLVAGRTTSEVGTVPVAYAALSSDLSRGSRVLIDDGNIELRARRITGNRVRCRILRGGVVTDNKGINLPGVDLSAPALTPKDRRDLKHAVSIGADWLAVSFVRRPEDVKLARRLLTRAGRPIPIMAKIERPEALDCLDDILEVSDGLLVARGDLGVELPPQDVPVLQKQIIEAANAAGKPVMTATQMLESMRHSRRPTRAEASDVANAVLDGSGCLLLTAETAVGDYPVEAVAMMASIIEKAESSGRAPRPPVSAEGLTVAQSTCLAGCRAAFEVGARYLVVFTHSGFSARQTANFRPRTPILAFAATAEVARQLRMIWGVRPRAVRDYPTIEKMIRGLDRALIAEGLAKRGDLVVVLAGTPVGVAGTTNLMRIQRVGGA